MELDLSGKAALVTGSSRGIGRAIAQTLHAEGCHVMLNARSSEALHVTAAAMGNAPAVVGDVTQINDAQRVVTEALRALGKLDILVCNVGSGRSVAPGKETPEEWQRVMALNLWSTIHMVEAARPALAATHGSIVCISSICGLEVIAGAPVTYSVAKAALHAYVRGIARPLGAGGIRINAIALGNILFDGSVWQRKLETDPQGMQTMLESQIALARFGTPYDVGHLVAYLASPLSSFVTGSIWTMDGGQVKA